MKIVVPIKLVPDLVEELSIDASGIALDTTWMRLIINEFDDHAIEQAILLKESSGGEVVVIAPEAEGIDDMLFTAAAKGVDRVIKLTGEFDGALNNHALSRVLAPIVNEMHPDLVLTGVQAHNDLDGPIGPLLAEKLGMPYVGYVSGVKANSGKATIRKEYPGGLIAEMDIVMPAVLGIQAAENPPRYVPISKVRQAMKTATIEELPAAELDSGGAPTVSRMFQPEAAEKATMIEGNTEEIAARIVEILKEQGVL